MSDDRELRGRLIRLAHANPHLRAHLLPILKESTEQVTAGAWKSLPKGWTQESLRQFWETLTGDVKHKVTKCIKQVEGTGIDDPGAFCASIADKMEPGWRSR